VPPTAPRPVLFLFAGKGKYKMSFIDFEEVKRLIPLRRALMHWGWPMAWGGVVTGHGSCPKHQGKEEGHRSCLLRGERWRCTYCGARGDVIEFAKYHYGVQSSKVAALALCGEFGAKVPYIKRREYLPRRVEQEEDRSGDRGGHPRAPHS
jgi:hypothetical protein